MSRRHRLALVHLEYGLLHRAGFIVISGEIGTGKTTLIKALLQRLDNQTEVASIFNTTVGPEEFLNLVLQEFDQDVAGTSRTEKLDRLNTFLIDHYAQDNRVVLIVDEAQNLSIETLEEIRLLSNLQTAKDYLLQIVLVGQPELRHKLSHPRMVQLAQRIAVHYHLAPLTGQETELYIQHRLEVASGEGDTQNLFTEEAREVIFQHTQGTPRLINLLCDACLVYAYADEVSIITGAMVEDVVKSQEGSGFSALSTATTPAPELEVPAVTAAGESLDVIRGLEAQVRELQSSLLILSRLVNERMLSGDVNKSPDADSSEEHLINLLEEQRAEIKCLTEERKHFLQRIAQMTVGPVDLKDHEVSGAEDNKKPRWWRYLWPRGL
ncbi:MAG: AAA family ATPase [Thermodesulfobacteriota bacterium]|nr:AAA family ATPase [Thermodesulfobacteriota bacterium]